MTIAHATFCVTREYAHGPERVFHAFSDEGTKRRWMREKSNTGDAGFSLDFRVDGREFSEFRLPDGDQLPPHVRGQRITNEAVIHDILTNRRIVYAYRMTIGGQCMSVSLATVEFTPTAGGTRLSYTEQGAYFTNADGPAMREAGWADLMEKLANELDRH